VSNQDERRIGDRNALCGLVTAVHQFADTDYQQQIWVEGSGPEWSSYSEALSQLFDDYRIREFVHGEAAECGFSEPMVQGLTLFADTLDSFPAALPPRISDADIVRREGWARVVHAAAYFMDAGALDWVEENCSPFPMFPLCWRGRTVAGTWKE
jgi:hypothetical protein